MNTWSCKRGRFLIEGSRLRSEGITVRASQPCVSAGRLPTRQCSFCATRPERVLSRPRGAALRAVPDVPERLQSAVEELWEVWHRDGTPQAELETALARVEGLGAELGADRVVPQWNQGQFQGATLGGKLQRDLAAGAVTMGRLSFNVYGPCELLVAPEGGHLAVVTKGRWREREGGDAYVVSTPFRVVKQEGKGGEFEGVKGVSHAIASFHPTPGDPRRLDIRFAALRLEPTPAQREREGGLARWLRLFQPSNPSMDSQGNLEIPLPPEASPRGYLDHLVMLPHWQLTQGNFGSKNLLRRVA